MFFRLVFGAFLVAIVLFTPLSQASAIRADGTPVPALAVSFSAQADHLIASFRPVYAELAEQDPTPLVRIYGDGKVVVYRPFYLKRPGRFEMHLSEQELQLFIGQLAAAMLSFDPQAVAREKHEMETAQLQDALGSGQVVIKRYSDAEYSDFLLDIDAIAAAKNAAQTVAVDVMETRWANLRLDAREHPNIESMQSLAAMENAFRALTERRELELVEEAP